MNPERTAYPLKQLGLAALLLLGGLAAPAVHAKVTEKCLNGIRERFDELEAQRMQVVRAQQQTARTHNKNLKRTRNMGCHL